jgi:hypothetical protein
MRVLLVALSLLLLPASLFAQPHPCDAAAADGDTGGSASLEVKSLYTLGWCQLTVDGPVRFKLCMNGIAEPNLLAAVSGTPSTTGYTEYCQ